MVKPARWRAKRVEEKKKEERTGKRAREVSLGAASLSEKRVCHKGSGHLRCRQTERGSKGCRNPKQSDRNLASGLGASISNDPLNPRETRVRSLSAGQDHTVMGSGAAVGGDRFTSIRWWRSKCMQARRWVFRLQSCQRRGTEPTGSGCNSTLTWRGFAVAAPFH